MIICVSSFSFLKEWVRVTESYESKSTLANILAGIMYRFRVIGVLDDGRTTLPSEPSDPFVVDLPGLQGLNLIKMTW